MVDRKHSRLMCDNCPRRAEISPRAVVLAPPWREVRIVGFVDPFHACSDRCEAAVRARYERPEPTVSVEAELPPRDDEPTIPATPPPELAAGKGGRDGEG